jgi:hypothetical protein
MSRQSRPPSRTQSFERTRRFFKSVSDIYGKDEMEELLDEIQHLEPCNFQSRDIQDVGSFIFIIACLYQSDHISMSLKILTTQKMLFYKFSVLI